MDREEPRFACCDGTGVSNITYVPLRNVCDRKCDCDKCADENICNKYTWKDEHCPFTPVEIFLFDLIWIIPVHDLTENVDVHVRVRASGVMLVVFSLTDVDY